MRQRISDRDQLGGVVAVVLDRDDVGDRAVLAGVGGRWRHRHRDGELGALAHRDGGGIAQGLRRDVRSAGHRRRQVVEPGGHGGKDPGLEGEAHQARHSTARSRDIPRGPEGKEAVRRWIDGRHPQAVALVTGGRAVEEAGRQAGGDHHPLRDRGADVGDRNHVGRQAAGGQLAGSGGHRQGQRGARFNDERDRIALIDLAAVRGGDLDLVLVVARIQRHLDPEAQHQRAQGVARPSRDRPRPPGWIALYSGIAGRRPDRIAAQRRQFVVMEPFGQNILDDDAAGRSGTGVADREGEPGEDARRHVPFVVGAGWGVGGLRDDEVRGFATSACGQRYWAQQQADGESV